MKKKLLSNESEIREMLKGANRPLRLDDILRIGHYSRKEKTSILACLDSLAASGSAMRLRGGGWASLSMMKRCRGRLAVQRSGAAFVRIGEGASKDVYVAPEHIGDAWNGDTVDVLILPGAKKQHGASEGRIISVVERGCSEIACRVLRRAEKGLFFCQPADSRMVLDILADAAALDHDPVPFELLSVTPLERRERTCGVRPLWLGRATCSLGVENGAEAQERLVKMGNLIPCEFPDNVIAEAEKASGSVSLDDLADLRSALLVTIDGDDARDFDDAICVYREQTGWRLLVAIADVSAYVRPHTALDREARERGNSFYFPLSVEPMLPEALSCGACSLRPWEDRRCMAVEMFLDEKGNLKDTHCCNAVMASHARLTYRQTQLIFDDPDGEEAKKLEQEAPGVASMLADAAELAELLIERRRSSGGLDFALPEAEYLTEEQDGARTVTGIRNRERLFSHRLIESFMVRANEAVAEFLVKKNVPFLFRVHPDPGTERLGTLCRMLQTICPEMPLPRPAEAGDPKWLTALLKAAEKSESRSVVSNLVLRSMMQARYSTEKDRHFGLASSCYCHFTSPIRRYADLENHRSLKQALGLESGLAEKEKLEDIAEKCNRQERLATAAERETERRMGCLLLEPHTGEEFMGTVSSVTSFGVFAQLDGMPVEGMIRIEDLPTDWYEFDEERMELCGRRSGKTFRPGQRLNLKLSGVNAGRLEINLEIQDNENGRGNRGKGPSSGKKMRTRWQRGESGRPSFARNKAGSHENRKKRFEHDGDGEFFSRDGERGSRRNRREWTGGEGGGFSEKRSFRGRSFARREEGERNFHDDAGTGRFRRHRENEGRRFHGKDDNFAGRRSAEHEESPFREHGGRRFSDRPFRRREDRDFNGRPFGRSLRNSRGFEDGDFPRDDRERTPFREKESRRRPFGRRQDDGRKRWQHEDGNFRREKGERKDFRRTGRENQDHSAGTTEDFFRIELETEKKPSFRFGRRKK